MKKLKLKRWVVITLRVMAIVVIGVTLKALNDSNVNDYNKCIESGKSFATCKAFIN